MRVEVVPVQRAFGGAGGEVRGQRVVLGAVPGVEPIEQTINRGAERERWGHEGANDGAGHGAERGIRAE